ncbi:MAG: tyrosine-type recombinase/integrase [Acidimicrobiales bacterium]
MWQCHIRDSIGTRRIAQLGPYGVESYFRELKAAGRSEASVRQIRAVLHRACRLARKWSNGSLTNPVAETELPELTLDESSEEVRSPTAEEIRRILAAAHQADVRLSAFSRLVAATGVGRGEACALRWTDVGWDDTIVRVDKAIVATVGGTSHRGPKTRASMRTAAIDTRTLDVLRTLFDRQQALAASCGLDLEDDAYVFATELDRVIGEAQKQARLG